MKKILFTTLCALAVAGALVSCNKDSGLVNPMSMKTGSGGGGTTPNPKIAFEGSTSDKRGTYSTLSVMDSTGSNLTNLLTGSSANNIYSNITWSPTGGHIAWREISSVGNYTAYLLKTGTVTVSNNVVTLTSVSTLLSQVFTTDDSETCESAAWTSQSSPSVIAIGARTYNSTTAPAKIWTEPSTGGSPTLLYTGNAGELIQSITWSPDGTRIAAGVRLGKTSPYTYCMKIINSSTGVMTDSLAWAQFDGGFGDVRWSNTGKNQIAFLGVASGVRSFYTYDYGTSTLSSAIVSGNGLVYWSPSNDKILYRNPTGGVDFYNFPTGTVTSISNGAPGDWRRD